MGLSEWLGRRVKSWTTKPFSEGMPAATPASKDAKPKTADEKLPSISSTSVPSNSTPSSSENSPAAAQPAVSNGTPEEIAEKIMILIPYIKQYRSQGMLDEEIVAFLIEHSWPEYIVKRAIKNA